MTQASSNPAFSLSTQQVQFDTSGGGSTTQTITLTNHTRAGLQFQVVCDQPWLTVAFGQQSADELPLILSIDRSQLSKAGPTTAVLQVQALGTTRQVTVAAAPGRSAVRTRQAPTASRRSKSRPPSPSGGRPGQGRRAAAPRRRGTSVGIGPSAVAALLFHGVLLTSAVTLAQDALGRTTPAQNPVVAVVLLLVMVYYFLAFRKGFPSRRRLLSPSSQDPAHQRLFRVLESVCQKAGVPMSRVVLLANPVPNVYSRGIGARWGCLYVYRGLLDAIQDDDELQAALAHEVGHLKRGETFFFSSVDPLLWVISAALRLLRGLGRGFGSAGRRLSSSSLGLPRMGFRMEELLGLLVILTALFVFAWLVLLAVTHALIVAGVLLVAALVCMLYMRHAEKGADIAAVRIVGDPDLVLAALARSVDHFPAERAILEQYAVGCLGLKAQFYLEDVVAGIKAGVVPTCGYAGQCSGVFFTRHGSWTPRDP